MNAIPTSDVYVIGTLLDRKVYSAQFGWIKPDDTRKMVSSLIFGRDRADEMMKILKVVPVGITGPIAIFEVDVSIGRNILTV